MPYIPIRFIIKKGSKETLTITFDPTNLPGQSISGCRIDFYLKRSIGQSYTDIYKSTVNGITEIEIISATQCNVYIKDTDTSSIQAGDYYWACKITGSISAILAISPDTQHGDLVLLDSAFV